MNYKDLEIWRRSILLSKMIYDLTSLLPNSEKYGLITQMRRAAISIPSNIAEGSGRNSTKEFIRYINIATGSLYELETQLILLEELKLSPSNHILSEHILPLRKMLFRFKQSLERLN